MKLWILTSETEEFVGGGIGQYVENFSRSLARAGHNVLVVCCGDRDGFEDVEENLRRFIFRPSYHTRMPRDQDQALSQHAAFPYNILHYWIALSWQMARVVESLVEKEGAPDAIECQEHNALGYYLIEKRLQDPEFLADTPIVLHLHSPDFILQKVNRRPLYRLPDYWRGWMEKQCIHRADSLVCPSAYMAKQVSDALDGRHPDITVVPLPHEPDARVPERKCLRRDIPEVLYIGRLERRKGVLEAVDACSRLWNQGHRFRLRLIGGDEPLVYGGETVWERLSNRFAGDIADGLLVRSRRVAHGKLAKLRAEADVLIIPSLWENFPNTAMEAMLGGATVLVSKAGGQADMVGPDGCNGCVFDWSKAGDFEESLLRLLGMTPEERLAMGRRGRARIMELCSPKAVVAERCEHFQKAISKCSKPDHYPFWSPVEGVPELVFRPSDGIGVTVVIPHRNHGAYLLEAVESALKSSFPVKEVLVVDDGSDEHGSQAVLDQLEERGDERVTVLRRAHAGLAATRNAGIQAASTSAVALLDADDRLGPEFLRKAVSLLERYPNIALVSSWIQYFGDSNGVFPCWDLTFPYLLVQNQLIPVCLVRRKAFLEHAQNSSLMEEGLEDWESWISLYERGGRGVTISEPLNFYRVRRDSMLRVRTRQAWPVLYGQIADRHASSFQAYGDEVAGLLASNPDPSTWHHPGLWTEWGPPEKTAILKRWHKWEKRATRIKEVIKRVYFKVHYLLRSLRRRLHALTMRPDVGGGSGGG